MIFFVFQIPVVFFPDDRSNWNFGIQAVNTKQESGKKKGDASWLMSRLYQTCHNIPQRDRLGSSRLVAVCKIMRWAKAGCMALAPAQGKKSLFWPVTTAEKPFRRRTRRRWPVALGKRAKLESPPRNIHIVACMTQKEVLTRLSRRRTTTGFRPRSGLVSALHM